MPDRDSNAAEQWRIDRAKRQTSSVPDRGVPAPSTEPAYDDLEAMCRAMSAEQLRGAIEAICGGNLARRLGHAESIALAALMAEEARRVCV